MSVLVCHKTRHNTKVHICNSRMKAVVSKTSKTACVTYAPEQVVYPDLKDPNDCTMTFSSRQNNTEFHFYRATLCVSAVFAVSVRLSVTFVHSIQTAEDIVKLLCSAIILFFDPQHRYAIQRGTPSGTQNRRGGKILRFSTEIAVYLGNGTRYAHDYNGTLIGNHRWRIDPCRFR